MPKASLCGHYEVVQYLLESGALCKRDTFQGERCLYNALNDRIRKLLLSYDYHKSADPLQPFASHITSLLTRDFPRTSDIILKSANESFHLHKFILASRCPYFSTKLSKSPDVKSWNIPWIIPSQAISIALRHVYLDEIPTDVGGGLDTGFSEDEILKGVFKIGKQLDIPSLQNSLLESNNPRVAGHLKRQEVEKGQEQLLDWFRENVLEKKVLIDSAQADHVKWDSNNTVFADVLLRADVPEDDAILGDEPEDTGVLRNSPNDKQTKLTSSPPNGVAIDSSSQPARSPSRHRPSQKSILFPVHRAMLIRSEFFLKMFSSPFREAQPSAHLPIIPVDCKPEVLEIVLTFLYTEKSDFPLEHAIDVLFAADLLLIEKLKVRAAVIISTLGNGSMRAKNNHPGPGVGGEVPAQEKEEEEDEEDEVINIYDVLRAGWLTRVPRLEEFAARYFAYRLETYIEEEEFAEVIQESAGRIQGRQETDSIELLDEYASFHLFTKLHPFSFPLFFFFFFFFSQFHKILSVFPYKIKPLHTPTQKNSRKIQRKKLPQ